MRFFAVGYDGQTPLHRAALHGNMIVISCLLKSRADINAQDIKGLTPLMITARVGSLLPCLLLLEVLLTHKISISSCSVLTNLAQARADPIRLDKEEKNCLHWAADSKHDLVVHWLLENPEIMKHVNDPDGNGQSALDIAASEKEICSRLIAAGATPLNFHHALEYIKWRFNPFQTLQSAAAVFCIPLAFIYYLSVLRVETLEPFSGAHYLFSVTYFLTLALYLRCWKGDPGIIKQHPASILLGVVNGSLTSDNVVDHAVAFQYPRAKVSHRFKVYVAR
jgi:hypothetical protein